MFKTITKLVVLAVCIFCLASCLGGGGGGSAGAGGGSGGGGSETSTVVGLKLTTGGVIFRSKNLDTTTASIFDRIFSYVLPQSYATISTYDQLYQILDTGGLTKQIFLVEVTTTDEEGNETTETVEKVVDVTVTYFERVSSDYVIMSLSSGVKGVVNLTNGEITKFDDAQVEWDLSSIRYFNGYLFGFDSTKKFLHRFNLSDKTYFEYIELPAHQTFMTGARFSISDVTLFWDDSGNTDSSNPNSVPLLVDENLNVLTQINDTNTSNFPPFVVETNGTGSKISSDLTSIQNYILVYSTDNKLIQIGSISGYYSHGLGPDPDSIDVSAQKLTFSSSGITRSNLNQITPFTTPDSEDNKPKRCRNEFTIDDTQRYVPFGLGVLTYNVANSASITMSFEYSGTTFNTILSGNNWSDVGMLRSCYVADKYFYYFKASSDQIIRIDMSSVGTVSEEVMVSKSGITSFYLTPKFLVYTTSSKTFKVKLLDKTDSSLSDTEAIGMNELVSLE